MKLLCALLIICGGIFGVFYFQLLPSPLVIMENWLSSQKDPGQPSTGPGDSRAAIRSLSAKVLSPLKTKEPTTFGDAATSVAQLRTSLDGNQAPAAARERAALNLLEQALADRQTCLKMASGGGGASALDKVPGVWHLVGDKSHVVNRAALEQKQRSSYWTQAAIAQWQQHSRDYAQRIEALLAQ
jgi:hypothetical protein